LDAEDWTFREDDTLNDEPGDKFAHTPRGRFGGAHIGYNRQIGRWVLGLEGTLSAGNVSQTSASPFIETTDRLSTELQTLWTVTGRLGYAWDRWMIYGKAGYAGGLIEVGGVDIEVGGVPASANQAQVHHGWTAGLGVEYLLTPNLVLGLEYGYIDLGRVRHVAHIETIGTFFDLDNEMTAHAVMGRLSYKFGR
jgi:outer membrane immunogenic protein